MDQIEKSLWLWESVWNGEYYTYRKSSRWGFSKLFFHFELNRNILQWKQNWSDVVEGHDTQSGLSLPTGRQLKVIMISRNQTQDPNHAKDEPSPRLTMVLWLSGTFVSVVFSDGCSVRLPLIGLSSVNLMLAERKRTLQVLITNYINHKIVHG